MTHSPKPTLLATALLGLCLSLPAAALPSADMNGGGEDEKRMSHGLSAVDQKFVSESLFAGRKEIEAARMAQARSAVPEVRTLAEHLITDHDALNKRLEGLGGGVRPFGPPSTASGAQHTNPGPSPEAPLEAPSVATDDDLARLDALQGAEFDRAWVQLMIDGHKASITRFSNANEGGGAEAQAVARDTLPLLRRHLSSLESLQGKLP